MLNRAADRAAAAVAAIPMHDRGTEVGKGKGGDTTLVIDRDAEAAIVATLEEAHAAGMRFDLVSEELGTRSFDGDGPMVVVDPIDGSRNARRGLPDVAISLAVSDGPNLRDVRVYSWFDDNGRGVTRPVAREVRQVRAGETRAPRESRACNPLNRSRP